MTHIRTIGMACLIASTTACVEPEIQDPAVVTTFRPDATTTGPRIWVEVDAENELALKLHGAELGDVFGWSTHLRFEDAKMNVSAAEVRTGPLGDAVELTTSRPGDLALAATRHDPLAPDPKLDEDVVLATAMLVRRMDAEIRLDLEDTVVRRRDGSYVAVTALGGRLVETSP